MRSSTDSILGEFLREVPLFRTLGTGELEQLAAGFTEVELAAGETIFTAGDRADALYVVWKGSVTLHKEVQGESLRALAHLGRGDFLGEMGLFGDGSCHETARATRPSVLLRIGREDLFAFLEGHPTTALKLEMAAARGHSTKAAAALASAERRVDRTRVHRKVTLRTADGDSGRAMLVDISKAGLRLAGAPSAWQPERKVPFHLLWNDHALRFFGRVAWRYHKTVGIELEDRTPDRDDWIERMVGQMLSKDGPDGAAAEAKLPFS